MRAALYILTLFASAALLFAVQPLAGKALLPQLGGVPGAWTACLLFFQAALLVGYGYVWALGRLRDARVGVAIHAAVLVTALALGPLGALSTPIAISAVEHPTRYALAFLGLNLGPSFVALSATAPLLSLWFGRVAGRRPYFLYAASNAGSLLALIAYPIAIEPLFDVPTQALGFRIGVGVITVGVLAAGIGVLRLGRAARADGDETNDDATSHDTARDDDASDTARDDDASDTARDDDASDNARDDNAREDDARSDDARSDDAAATGGPVRERLRWIALSFVPALLLAGASSVLSLDVAPLPLLWVIPLAIYIGSYVLAFSDALGEPPPWLGRAMCLVAVVLIYVSLTHSNEPLALILTMHCLFLGAASWLLHRRLARAAPEVARLPEFYVWLALGGVLGTLVASVIAPAVLPDLYEYPVAIALACGLRPREGVVRPDRALGRDLVQVAVVAVLVAAGALIAPLVGLTEPEHAAVLILAPAALYSYRWMPLRRRYTLCLLALLTAAATLSPDGARVESVRSFFGVVRVIERDGAHALLHGTTLHGLQRLDERDACVPRPYYVHDGPAGRIFLAHRARGRRGRTAVVGLGTGALSCYAEPGEPWRYFEIDPTVAELARDPALFTYLANTPTDDLEIQLADGRVALTEEPDGALALLVVDAFSSDSVPAHLLTTEALALYMDKLAPGGWAVLHLSNRALDLPGVVANGAAALGLSTRFVVDDSASYVVLARRDEDLAGLSSTAVLPAGDPARAWTDRFSSLWRAIRRGSHTQ